MAWSIPDLLLKHVQSDGSDNMIYGILHILHEDIL
jgi:hypothetical protein